MASIASDWGPGVQCLQHVLAQERGGAPSGAGQPGELRGRIGRDQQWVVALSPERVKQEELESAGGEAEPDFDFESYFDRYYHS